MGHGTTCFVRFYYRQAASATNVSTDRNSKEYNNQDRNSFPSTKRNEGLLFPQE